MSQLTAYAAIAQAATGAITLVDVREGAEIKETGMAKDAVHIPLALISLKAADKIDKSKPVAVYCAVGGRAGLAVQTLLELGYDAHSIGGFKDWASAGGPVSR